MFHVQFQWLVTVQESSTSSVSTIPHQLCLAPWSHMQCGCTVICVDYSALYRKCSTSLLIIRMILLLNSTNHLIAMISNVSIWSAIFCIVIKNLLELTSNTTPNWSSPSCVKVALMFPNILVLWEISLAVRRFNWFIWLIWTEIKWRWRSNRFLSTQCNSKVTKICVEKSPWFFGKNR